MVLNIIQCQNVLLLKEQGINVFKGGISNLIVQARNQMRDHLVEMETYFHTPLDGGDLWEDDDGTFNGPYICGEQFTTADVGMMPIFERLEVGGWNFLWADLPGITSYWQNLKSRPSYQLAFKDHEIENIGFAREEIKRWKEENPWFKSWHIASLWPGLTGHSKGTGHFFGRKP